MIKEHYEIHSSEETGHDDGLIFIQESEKSLLWLFLLGAFLFGVVIGRMIK